MGTSTISTSASLPTDKTSFPEEAKEGPPLAFTMLVRIKTNACGRLDSGTVSFGIFSSVACSLLVFSLYFDFYISDKLDSKLANLTSCGDDKYHQYKP